jgi:hypothetical protein
MKGGEVCAEDGEVAVDALARKRGLGGDDLAGVFGRLGLVGLELEQEVHGGIVEQGVVQIALLEKAARGGEFALRLVVVGAWGGIGDGYGSAYLVSEADSEDLDADVIAVQSEGAGGEVGHAGVGRNKKAAVLDNAQESTGALHVGPADPLAAISQLGRAGVFIGIESADLELVQDHW